MDTQQIELVGRAALESRLVREGFEVARPHRDKGIDLIVFLDEPASPFAALPIQVKAYTGTTFGAWRKYEQMSGLVFVYIWDVLRSPRFFLMDFAEAATLIPDRQKLTASWNRTDGRAGWHWTAAPRHVAAALPAFEDRWDWLRQRLVLARATPVHREGN
jgi:hypothetical protein